MDQELYGRLLKISLKYSLEISVEEGIMVLQGDNETIAVVGCDNQQDKLKIEYLTLSHETAAITLRDCPVVIKDWYQEFSTPLEQRDWYKKLRDPEGTLKNYVPLPHFRSTLDLETALAVCEYLASKIEANNFRARAN